MSELLTSKPECKSTMSSHFIRKSKQDTDRLACWSFCSLSRDVPLMPIVTTLRCTVVALLAAVSCGVIVVSPCYVYPVGTRDPCVDRQCSFGARCVPSLDGLTSRCQCPERCDDYGDSVGAGPLCADDGRDYQNDCEMTRTACRDLREITRKYDGKCGE